MVRYVTHHPRAREGVNFHARADVSRGAFLNGCEVSDSRPSSGKTFTELVGEVAFDLQMSGVLLTANRGILDSGVASLQVSRR